MMPDPSSKPIAEECWPFTVAKLARQKLLRDGTRWTSTTTWPNGREDRMSVACQGSGGADGSLILYLDFNLCYTDGTRLPCGEPIGLAGEYCNVGRWRWWLVCPRCQTRRRVLYLPPGRTNFACRVCHDLRYKSSLRSRRQRRWWRGY